jgi:hypothetical protein
MPRFRHIFESASLVYRHHLLVLPSSASCLLPSVSFSYHHTRKVVHCSILCQRNKPYSSRMKLGLGLGWSTRSLVLLSAFSLLLLGHNFNCANAFQSPTASQSTAPRSSLRRQAGQLLPLAASYSAFEDNHHNNGSNNNHNRQAGSNKGVSDFSFAEKRSIESRLNRLEQTAAATLQGFYEPHLLSFSMKPGSANVRIVSYRIVCLEVI